MFLNCNAISRHSAQYDSCPHAAFLFMVYSWLTVQQTWHCIVCMWVCGLLTVSSEVVMASTGRLLSLWEAHNKKFPQNFLLMSELFCFLLFVVFCAQELYRVIADGGKVFTEQQYETVLRLMILQGQSTATQSTAEYKRKLKLALAGRRVSSITH